MTIPAIIITQFIYSNRDVYIAIALCSKLLHSAIAIHIDIAIRVDELGIKNPGCCIPILINHSNISLKINKSIGKDSDQILPENQVQSESSQLLKKSNLSFLCCSHVLFW
jgi:hypothetical protein